MIPELRRAYNAAYSDAKYEAYKARLAAEAGLEIPFRLAETPLFLPPSLRDVLVRTGLEIVDQLMDPRRLAESLSAIPAEFDVPHCDAHPTFIQIDFGLARGDDGGADGAVVPRLIELQGFPSLYAFQLYQGAAFRDITPDGQRLDYLLSGLDRDRYVALVGQALVSHHSPEEVVLIDLDPPRQKTYPDFVLTERLWGVRAIDPSGIERRGAELFYRRDGRSVRIKRIYNRIVVDELQAKRIELPFRYTDELDVEWAGHPNWFFRWSKHSLPDLDHPAVPTARLLSEVDPLPDDPEAWVLKPLFAFAGAGVRVDVTRDDLEAVPADRRAQMLLMRKVDYAPVVSTVDGLASKAEVRLMLVWPEEVARPVPVTTLVRLSQGAMMGVDFNRERTWVGSSTSLWPTGN